MPTLRHSLADEIAFARVNLGMPREEFMRQTPDEWARLFVVWQERELRENRRVARICTVLAWCNGNPDAIEEDFVPRKPSLEPQQTDEEMMAALDASAPKQIHG